MKVIIGTLMAIALLSLILVGNAITGFIVGNPGVGEVCSMDLTCSDSQVCCVVYGEEEAGVCQSSEMCDEVYEITKTQKLMEEEWAKSISMGEPVVLNVSDLRVNFMVQFLYGGVVFVLVLFILVYIIKHHSNDTKKKKRVKV